MRIAASLWISKLPLFLSPTMSTTSVSQSLNSNCDILRNFAEAMHKSPNAFARRNKIQKVIANETRVEDAWSTPLPHKTRS